MLLKTKIEIEKWLNKYHIKNYELIENKKYGYVVNVNGSVDLYNKKLKSIDVKFNIVNGNFDCSWNVLESLIGSPKIVKGYFECIYNNLKSLEGCPKIIKENFNCSYNKLISLEGMVKEIKHLNLSHNNLKLESLIKLLYTKIETNYIILFNNEKLGELQKVKDFNEIKKILTIYKEKTDLDIILKQKNMKNLVIGINNKKIEKI